MDNRGEDSGDLLRGVGERGGNPERTRDVMVSASRASSTSAILVPTGDQDPTVHLTQSFWMAVAPPILVANQI